MSFDLDLIPQFWVYILDTQPSVPKAAEKEQLWVTLIDHWWTIPSNYTF